MIKTIVWDIGGVLVDDPKVGDFWKNKEGSKELRAAFGSGKISSEDFIKEGAKLLGLSEEVFLIRYKKAYFSIKFMKPFDLYKKFKNNYILSDTNPLHSEFIKKEFPELFKFPKKVFLSTEIGMRKNSTKIFKFLIKKLKSNPEEILFIDNKQSIVNLAKEVGIKTILFENLKQLKKDLKSFGINL